VFESFEGGEDGGELTDSLGSKDDEDCFGGISDVIEDLVEVVWIRRRVMRIIMCDCDIIVINLSF